MYEELTLAEYINLKKQVLKEAHVYKHCTAAEKAELKAAKTDAQADRICRSLIERHFDEAQQECELDVRSDIKIIDADLPNKIKFAILRSGISTAKEFVNFVNDNGWGDIRRFGEDAAIKTFSYIYPSKNEKEIKAIVKKFRNVR